MSGVAIASGCETTRHGEDVRSASQNVANGTVDTGDKFPFVVAISLEGQPLGSRFCSGTLVTRNRVMSAAHCFDGEGVPVDQFGSVDIHFVTHSGGVKTVTTVTHRPSFTGGVQTNVIRTFREPGSKHRGGDMAIVTLDSHVTFVTPLQIATPEDWCPHEFSGDLVGFGPTGDQPPSCGLVWAEDRSSAFSHGWEFEGTVLNGTYENTWNFTGYEGSLPSDSGGALVHGGRLCGVVSGHGGITCNPVFGAMFAWASCAAPQTAEMTAETTGPLTEQESVLSYTDPRTGEKTWIGECPASYLALDGANPTLASADSDSDGIPDLCDTCPKMRNIDQIYQVESDTDGDGIPDGCDLCRRVANRAPSGFAQDLARLFPWPDTDGDEIGDLCDWCTSSDPQDKVFEQELANPNLESELAFYYPGLSAPPVITLSADYEDQLTRYRSAFKIGTCDVAPTPVMTLNTSGAFPPGVTTSKKCILPMPGICKWVPRNDLWHRPKPSPATVGEVGQVHAKWCDCPYDVTSIEGRVLCQQGKYLCYGVQALFELEQWRELRTAPVVIDKVLWEQAGPEQHSYAMVEKTQARALWDYFALGSPYVRNVQTGGPYVPGVDDPGDAAVNGPLWNAVREMNKFPPGTLEYDEIQKRGNHYGRGDARLEQLGKVFVTEPTFHPIDLYYPCLDCPFPSLTNLLIDPTLIDSHADPVPARVNPTGAVVSKELLSPAALSNLVDAERGNLRLASAVENPGLLAELSGSGTVLRGMLLDPASGAPLRLLVQTSLYAPVASYSMGPEEVGAQVASGLAADEPSSALDMLALAEPAPDQNLPGALDPGVALVFTGERGLLFRFGGKHPAVAASAWIYRARDRRWTEVVLDKKAEPGSIVAGSFQREDGYVYALDTPPTGPTGPMWLRRWRPGTAKFEPLARWTAALKNFEQYWLVPSDEGEIYLVAAKTGASVIERFVPSPDGSLLFAGVQLLNARILERPFASRGVIGFVVHAPVPGAVEPFSGVRQEQLLAAEITAKPKQWAPIPE